MCQYASFRSIDVANAFLGRTCLTSSTVVILKVGHKMDLFRVDRSRMTRLLSVFFLGTEKRGP